MSKIFVVFLLLISSVSFAKKEYFEKNKSTIESLSKIYVMTDSMIVDDLKGSDVGVEVEYNYQLNELIFSDTKKILDGQVKAELVHAASAIGLHEADNVYVPDSLDLNNKIILPVVNESIGIDRRDEFIQKLDPLFERSHKITQSFKERRNYAPDMKEKSFERVSWLNLQEDEAVLMIIASGLKVPGKKSAGQGIATAVLTLGMFVSFEVSITQFNLVLVNHDGELLWANAKYKQGKPAKKNKPENFMYSALRTMPVKIRHPESRNR